MGWLAAELNRLAAYAEGDDARQCRQCGGLFYANGTKRQRRIYCCDACYQRARRVMNRDRLRYLRSLNRD